MSVGEFLRQYLPGIATLVAVAAAARVVGAALPGVAPLVVAVATGVLLANTVGTPDRLAAGVGLHDRLLEAGVVLLGASVSLAAVAAAGPLLVGSAVCIVAFGLVCVEAFARLAGLDARTGSLLAAGSSVCGVSAVVAAAGAVDADESQVAYAAATVLLFDAVTLVVFPPLGHLLGLSPRAFGVWAGLSMFSTGPVTAAGFAFSRTAGEWAALTKLARNSFIGVVAVGYSLRYASRHAGGTGGRGGVRSRLAELWDGVPAFLLGFLALAVATNAGLVPPALRDALGVAVDWLFLLAFAGLGFDIRVDRMRAAGVEPLAVVGAYLLVVSGLAYVLVTTGL